MCVRWKREKIKPKPDAQNELYHVMHSHRSMCEAPLLIISRRIRVPTSVSEFRDALRESLRDLLIAAC